MFNNNINKNLQIEKRWEQRKIIKLKEIKE